MAEKLSQFIREFSKKNSQAERDVIAQKIWNKRKEIRSQQSDHAMEKDSLVDKQQTISKEYVIARKEFSDRFLELEKLKELVSQFSSSNFGKLWNYFKINRLRIQIDLEGSVLQEEQEKTYREHNIAQLQNDAEITSLEEPPMLREAEKILENFYVDQERKWAETPYTKEDIKKYFSDEYLASLSLEDYLIVMKRFPSEMVAHVTRQGITDHCYGMHTSPQNIGKFSNNFINILEKGRLIPFLELVAGQTEKMAIIKYFGLPNKTKEEALACLDQYLDPNRLYGTKNYHDSAAIHFSSEGIADAIYGSETGNTPFIAFPSLLIATQCYFIGDLNRVDGTSGGVHPKNDKFVWTVENKGININAGIVFIPEDAQVDPKNGSIYELGDDFKPISSSQLRNDKIRPSYKEANRTITSKEYWTNYFTDHPDLKPSKVVFYSGEDPTAAYHQWKLTNGLVKESNKADMGFPEKIVDFGSSLGAIHAMEQKTGADRFRQMVTAIFEEYYSSPIEPPNTDLTSSHET